LIAAFHCYGKLMIRITRAALLGATCLMSMAASAQSAVPPSSPARPASASAASSSTPPGPDARVKITDDYAALVARDAYFWAWPMVNLYNRRLAAAQVTKMMRSGPTVSAPLNRLGMITDYVDPAERLVACPNQDVVYGLGVLALDISPVVIQVPDFGDRFWVYQAVDLRTDSFVQLGKMYDTKPGFYLLAGPNWKGEAPKGITKVFRASTNTGVVVPRIFQDESPEDKRAVQAPLRQVVMYPLAEFDGTMKSIDWSKIPQGPAPDNSEDEVKWVAPEKFVEQIAAVLADAPPLPGEEARYAQIRAVLEAAKTDPRRQEAMARAAVDAENNVVAPLFQFRAWGQQLPYQWSTISNEAAFGTDYFTRTAVARSNILVNAPNETKYFYQDFDAAGARLNGRNRYTVTFPKGLTPPVNGFWSMTLYNQHHFFAPNAAGRYSVGTKTRDLKYDPDGSLTIYVQADPPPDDLLANWLPTPKDADEKGDFSLYIRAYWPKAAVTEGAWTPPPVENAN
jgi:hypothetical protein